MRAKRRLLGVIAALAMAAGATGGTTLAQFSATTSNSGNSFSATSLFYRATVLADAPVSYWRLGETSGTTAADVQGTNPGTYAGGYTLGQPGALAGDTNTAADFAGTSGRISVPHSSSLNLTSQVSIEAWVKPDTVSGGRFILNKSAGNLYYLYIANNELFFGIRSGGAYPFIKATGVVTTGAWQHLVGTFDGSTMTLYRNGVKVAEATGCSCPIDTATSAVFIGATDASINYFDGALDEVALYNYALTPTQVQTHYSRR